MADIDTSSGGGHGKHKGGVRSKKLSTRVDLTPMVDLAFLLISFFMLTTQLSKSVAMDLAMPKKPTDETVKPEPVAGSKVLNLIADKDDVLWYYPDVVVAGLKKTDYTPKGLRDIILKRQAEVKAKWGLDDKGDSKMVVLIKLTDDATYKNMVDILDEMDITKTKIYAIQDVSPLELEAIKNGGNASVSQ
ncbi:MAG TPA: biopolymer transporter ExbD [Chitinophagales bacterium]|nr:biopolymer transporter ExbD [Chitinophagales bacterium]HNM31368.1 biopolymer transporter ExbD [Chitinophagales bacterium]